MKFLYVTMDTEKCTQKAETIYAALNFLTSVHPETV